MYVLYSLGFPLLLMSVNMNNEDNDSVQLAAKVSLWTEFKTWELCKHILSGKCEIYVWCVSPFLNLELSLHCSKCHCHRCIQKEKKKSFVSLS